MNWSRKFNRRQLSNISEEMINEIINNLHDKKFNVFEAHKLDTKEIELMFRWPLYVITNIFIERITRLMSNKKMEIKKNNLHYIFNYRLNTLEVTHNLYNNDNLNYILLILIKKILQEENIKEHDLSKYITFNNKSTKIDLKLFFKNILKNIRNFFFNKKYRNKYVYDNYHQLNSIFPKEDKLLEMSYDKKVIDTNLRKKIRDIIVPIASNYFFMLDNKISNQKLSLLSFLYSRFVDYSLPLSLMENLYERVFFYNKIISNNNIDKIHSAVGFYFSDNLKIFSILAKRKNTQTKLIQHEHGLNNFISIISKNPNLPDFYKAITPFNYLDYFLAWGEGKISDKFLDLEKKVSMKVINVGSVYLNNIKQTHIKKIDNNNQFLLLYSASPSRNFMTNLEEITPEHNIEHQKKVFDFISIILKKYKNSKLIYKPFTTCINQQILDYIKEKKLDERNFIISNNNAVTSMKIVDLVLFDNITTGLGEAISIGVPAIVYDNKFDYNKITKEGKEINDLLHKNKIIFYNQVEGVEIVSSIKKDYSFFYKNSIESINQFQKLTAFPRSKKEFLKILSQKNFI